MIICCQVFANSYESQQYKMSVDLKIKSVIGFSGKNSSAKKTRKSIALFANYFLMFFMNDFAIYPLVNCY